MSVLTRLNDMLDTARPFVSALSEYRHSILILSRGAPAADEEDDDDDDDPAVPIIDQSFIAGILAHRRNENAIAANDVTKFKGGK
jgi:hypothetical protein